MILYFVYQIPSSKYRRIPVCLRHSFYVNPSLRQFQPSPSTITEVSMIQFHYMSAVARCQYLLHRTHTHQCYEAHFNLGSFYASTDDICRFINYFLPREKDGAKEGRCTAPALLVSKVATFPLCCLGVGSKEGFLPSPALMDTSYVKFQYPDRVFPIN